MARFTVLFCNAIQHTDPTDVRSLKDFVASLESCRSVSGGAEQLYKMCLLFLKVAVLYIHAKTQETPDAEKQRFLHPAQVHSDATASGFNTTAQFGPHLNALGLMPDSAWPMSRHGQVAPQRTQNAYAQAQYHDIATGLETADLSNKTMNVTHDSIQAWFSGSQYLINSMEVVSDLQMFDVDNIEFPI